MTERNATSEEARREAERALASGQAGDKLAASEGRVLDPIPVRSPEGDAAGWFAGIERNGILLGFVQLDAAGRFHRYSSFSRRQGEGPSVADWLDPAMIVERARACADPAERLGTPVLTYDVSPDRLTWMVPAVRPDGRKRLFYVAGKSVWTAPRRP